MHQRREAKIGEFLLATISDLHFGGTLHHQLAGVGAEVVHRQSLHESAAFHAADARAPAVERKRLVDIGGHGIRRIAPQVVLVHGAVHALFVIERLHGHGGAAVRLAHEHARRREGDVARVFRVAEGFPLRVLGAVEDLRQVTR